MPAGVTVRALFAGRRGRLLAALLFTEFGGAVQSIAFSTVLPIASNALHGTALYGATLGAGTFASILVLAVGAAPLARLSPAALLGTATGLFVVGTALSVGATAMVMLLAGSLVRGVAAGMLAGFGLSALGGLFEGEARVRVYGLFAVVWLLPSVVGPVANAALTVAFGWRAALAWPAVLVVLGRVLISRDLNLVPWQRSTAPRPSSTWTVTLLAGLLLAGLATRTHGVVGIAMLAGGCSVAAAATLQILRVQLAAEPARLGRTVLLFLLCLAFFGGTGIASLAVVSGFGFGVVAAAAVVGVAVLGWSVTGLVSQRVTRAVPVPQVLGMSLVAAGQLAALVTQIALAGAAALALLVVGFVVTGIGMGLAYPRISSSAMDNLPPEHLFPVATAVEFAELSGTAIGAFVGGGTYSLARSFQLAPTTALTWSFALLAALASVGAVLARTLSREP